MGIRDCWKHIALLSCALVLTSACQDEAGPAEPASSPSEKQTQRLEPSASPTPKEIQTNPGVQATTSAKTVGHGSIADAERASSLQGFDKTPEGLRATLLGLGMDVNLDANAPGFSLQRSPVYDRAQKKLLAPREVYRLGQLTIEREGGERWELSGASSSSQDGSRFERHFKQQGVTERYDHRAAGLEQSLVLAKLPEGAGELSVRYAIETSGLEHAPVEGSDDLMVIDSASDTPLFRWTKLIVTDANGERLDARMTSEGGALVYTVANVDKAALPLTIDPIATMPDQTAEGDITFGVFGAAASGLGDINNDGFDDLLVGQPYYPTGNPATGTGRVLLFLGRASGLGNTADWSMDGEQAGNGLGFGNVHIAEDVNDDGFDEITFAATNFNADPNDPNAPTRVGKAYVVLGAASIADLTESWTFTGTITDGRIGTSLSSVGDVNCDGFNDLGVASYFYNGRGRVDVFYGEATPAATPQIGGLSATPNWTINGVIASQQGSNMGRSIGPAGNPLGRSGLNGEQCGGILIGESGHRVTQQAQGRALAFFGSTAGLPAPNSPDWTVVGAAANLSVGVAVTGGGDLNGDGVDDIAVAQNAANNVGKVIVYYGNTTTGFSTTPDWEKSGSANNELYGSALKLIPSVNGDINRGVPTPIDDLLIGAANFQSGLGKAELYLGSEEGLRTSAKWSVVGAAGERLGFSVSGGDFNGDDVGDLIVGSLTATNTNGNAAAGKVGIYHGSQTCFFFKSHLFDGEIDPDTSCAECDTSDPANPIPRNEGVSCDDGNSCTSGNTCTNGSCVFQNAVDCSNLDDECNVGVCDPSNGACNAEPVADGTACSDDGLTCTSDVCLAGTCDHPLETDKCLISGTCYDENEPQDSNNPCSAACVPATSQSMFSPIGDGNACDDGDECTTGETCSGGTCGGGGAVTCDDSDLCTTDSCDSATGCVFTDIALDCTSLDGDCTQGACDPSTGACAANPVNDANACDDNDACTAGEVCSNGSCTNGATVTCNDMNDCTADFCDMASGCSSTPVMQGVGCDEMDALPCTAGQCDGAGGCATVVTVGCAINGACVPEGAENPLNNCEVCDSTQSTTSYSPKMAGEVCLTAECLMDGRFQPESACDGAGTCSVVMPENCGLYTCDMGCKTTCASDADCLQPGAFCNVAVGECLSDGTNLAPNADAGVDQAVTAETLVTLDGSGSSDPNAGDTLTYAWEFVSSSTNTTIMLTDADTISPSFTAPREPAGSSYVFRLTVTDSGMPTLSDSDEVTINIDGLNNTEPTAVITGQETASPGETFTLSGADSTDPEDDPITGFEWILVDTGAPTPTLVGLDQEELEVTIPNDLMQTTEYRFELYVTDAFGLESLQPAQHTVTVNVMVDPDMGMDMGADMGGEPDMDTDMGGEPDMDTDMGGEPDMDVEDDMGGQADMGADMGPTPMGEDNGELQGSSCFCASVDHQQQAPPTWLLAVALGFLGLVRRRRRS